MASAVVNLPNRQAPELQIFANNPSESLRSTMSDTPSRAEVAAELRAAEARTETRIAELRGAMEAHALAADHKIDQLVSLMSSVKVEFNEKFQDLKEDSKDTRRAIWHVGIGAVLATLTLVVALWIAGINIQNNMIAVFQTGLSIHGMPTNPSSASLPSPSPQGSQGSQDRK